MLNLGDRFRLKAHPRAPLLTVVVIYLDGDPEELCVGCRWTPPGQKVPAPGRVHFPLTALEPA